MLHSGRTFHTLLRCIPQSLCVNGCLISSGHLDCSPGVEWLYPCVRVRFFLSLHPALCVFSFGTSVSALSCSPVELFICLVYLPPHLLSVCQSVLFICVCLHLSYVSFRPFAAPQPRGQPHAPPNAAAAVADAAADPAAGAGQHQAAEGDGGVGTHAHTSCMFLAQTTKRLGWPKAMCIA